LILLKCSDTNQSIYSRTNALTHSCLLDELVSLAVPFDIVELNLLELLSFPIIVPGCSFKIDIGVEEGGRVLV
jgi:hypothetical protein